MIDSVSIPIATCAKRRSYLSSFLISLYKHSVRRHEVIVCTEDSERLVQSIVDEIILPFRRKPIVRVVHVAPIKIGKHPKRFVLNYMRNREYLGFPKGVSHYKCGYNPLYQMLQVGALLSAKDWVCTPAGDDTYFPPGWEALLAEVNPQKRLSHVWIPSYISTEPRGSWDSPGKCRDRVYPRTGESTVRESALLRAASRLGQNREVVAEPAAARIRVSWPHGLIHRELFVKMGGYKVLPPFPSAQDLQLHTDLASFKVTAVGVLHAAVINSKLPVRMGE